MQLTSIHIGSSQIFLIQEFVDTSFLAGKFFPNLTPNIFNDAPPWLIPSYYHPQSDALILSMHSWLVKTDRHTLLVDACVGNDKDRLPRTHWHLRQGNFLQQLASLGVSPSDIDFVMCTHMHADHVGWNTIRADGDWVPTFPNAQYLFSKLEYQHASTFNYQNPIMGKAFQDSVLPIITAGQALMINDGHEIDDMFTVQLAPGHTPGNAMLQLQTSGQEALFVGDVIHHPIQVYHPELSTIACLDAEGSHQSRLRMLNHCCNQHALMLPAHFSAPHGGYIQEKSSGFELEWMTSTFSSKT